MLNLDNVDKSCIFAEFCGQSADAYLGPCQASKMELFAKILKAAIFAIVPFWMND